MKLAIFGGTGRTGQYLVRAALEKGYRVTMLARDPSKLSPAPNATVVRRDVKDLVCVQQRQLFGQARAGNRAITHRWNIGFGGKKREGQPEMDIIQIQDVKPFFSASHPDLRRTGYC